MKLVVGNRVVLSRTPQGPIAPHLGPFAEFISAQGYALDSIRRQVHLAACFSGWLERQRVTLERITPDAAKQYLQHRVRHLKPARGDAAALRHLIEFVRGADLVPAETPPQLTPVERCTEAYVQYLREVQGLAEATIRNYAPFANRFLNTRFADGPVVLSALCARDVVTFVQRQAPLLSTKRAKLMTSGLRSFLRYLRYCGEVVLDLAAAVPVVPNWSMPSIPRAISADQVDQLLASIDQRTATGRRDYAIVLLLARLGLRAGEVVFLQLDDIDWHAAILNVRGKSGRRHEFPLAQDVGEAIAAYLRNGRPAGRSRRVFLRARAPIRGFQSASGVGSVVRHALQRAGIQAPTYGAHQFRHGLACEMLRQGASLGEIGDVLGHRRPQTTKIYTKVELKALRTLALPWPGEVR